MIAFLRGIWRRAYMRGFTAGFRDGLTAGLVETVAEHSNVALIPDDVITAFWTEYEARKSYVMPRPYHIPFVSDGALYQTLERHLIPESEA
jgi:hypothetical protein